MRRLGIQCAAFLVGLTFGSININQAEAQELRMRPRSGWSGNDSGQPSQKWTPGIEQQERKRQEDVLRGWQEAELPEFLARTPKSHSLKKILTQFQRDNHDSAAFEAA